MTTTGTREVVRKALLDSLSLPAIILLTTMMGFGSLARSAGYDASMATVATLLIWGLPGQLAMVELTTTGQGIVAIIFACSLANARFLPMVVTFIPAMSSGNSKLSRMILDAQLLSINSWAMCLREFPRVAPDFRRLYFLTFASSILLSAIIGTLLGYHAAVWLPASLVLGLIFISPLFFALLLSAVSGRAARISLLLGCVTIPITHYWFPAVDLLITGVVGGSLGFVGDKIWSKIDAK
jgi:predicted branched-subunit amino acid permease